MTMHRMLTTSALTLVVAATLAACGGGGDGGDGVATLGDGATATTTDAGSGGGEMTDAEREDAMLAFAQCMRDHGIDMPDPTSAGPGGGGGGRIAIGVEGAGKAEFQAAEEACQSILGDAFGDRQAPSAEEQAQMQDDMLAFAQCMRDHGVDMPDPEFDSGGGGMGAIMRNDGIDPSDPAFQTAQTACQDELGFEGGKGPGFHAETGGPSKSSTASGGGA